MPSVNKRASTRVWLRTLLIGMILMTWGCGVVDILSLLEVGKSDPKPTFYGYVLFGGTGLSGVTITVTGRDTRSTVTGADGFYSFGIPEIPAFGDFTITPSRSGFTFYPLSSTSDALAKTDILNFEAFCPIKGATSTHTLFNNIDGIVLAWGRNAKGQLGDGTTNDSTSAVQVKGLKTAIAVAAGTDFSLALKADGTVWAWGDNTYGQLGDETTITRMTPVQVIGISSVIAIAAGNSHAAVLKSDGTVWAWGDNTYGQLGNGSTLSSATPVQTSTLTGIIAVSAGFDHTLALLHDGTVWAWGNNSNGQLGDGTKTGSSIPVKTSIAGGVQIAAGNKFSVSLIYSSAYLTGAVSTWGINTDGQLGNGTTEDSLAPAFIGSFVDIVSIAAGNNHAVAIKHNGAVWAWGGNAGGQLGNDTNVSSSIPVQSTTFANATFLSSGIDDTIAFISDGTVWAWGDNTYGQLGDGTTIARWTPVQVR